VTDPPLPRTDRPDAPAYLARYQQRRARPANPSALDRDGEAEQVPLYLRRFRDRRGAPTSYDAPPPLWSGPPLPPGVTREWADVARSREIIAPPSATPRLEATVHLIRHGETQGYSTDSGLTPLGGWQAHRRGHDLSKGLTGGELVRLVCADTNRARQTAEQIHRGLLDGLELWGRKAVVQGPEPRSEFRNFGVATPSGVRDVTAAFREYQTVMERYERAAAGDRPLWLVEMDRFWSSQQGGADPIYHWLTVPMLHFEPPAVCVRRFWAGITRLVAESSGARILCATHSGPIRAFATWAVGYDPGEPYNTEEVLVKVHGGGRTALVAYRNRVQEVRVPPAAELPVWEVGG
jgi:broad specificity phosphatase PhoE